MGPAIRPAAGRQHSLPVADDDDCDIYDALTASDRPYKSAVQNHVSSEILETEVSHGKLNRDLFELFLDGKVYERVATEKQYKARGYT